MKTVNKNLAIFFLSLTIVAVYMGLLAHFYFNKLPQSAVNAIIDSFKPEDIFIFFFPLLLIVLMFLNVFYKLWIKPLSKISEGISVIQNANPGFRIDVNGSKKVIQIADLINKYADKNEGLSENVKSMIENAGRQLEDEKNILAAFISELSEGVLICRHDGRVLLFNKMAKEFLAKDSENRSKNFIGLGRSVFTIIDKNIIIHALDEIQGKLNSGSENCMATFVIVGPKNNQLKVEAVPILDTKKIMTGFIFIMSDITTQIIIDKKSNIMLQNLTKTIRSSLGGIRAAVETIIDFPEMEVDQRKTFTEIILKEAKSLGESIDQNQKEYSTHIHTKWPLVHITAKELIDSYKSRISDKISIDIETYEIQENLWLKTDSYSMIMALYFLTTRICDSFSPETVKLKAYLKDKFVNIDLVWQGDPLAIDTLSKWSKMPLMVENEGISLTLSEVIEHHNAEILPHFYTDSKELSALKLFIPHVETPGIDTRISSPISLVTEQRPQFYDFDLFEQQVVSSELQDTLLKDITYTVFDTETTGLNPSGGDEIISIGAVRIVNGKLLYNDIYEQLVDPKRSVPQSSIEIHGISPAMLEGQPDVKTVLPQFYKFTEATVLVGHNVAFDMAMLKMKEEVTGIKFTAPVLDTLLLSTIVNTEQDDEHSIEAITERLGISVIGRHTAVGDAITTAEMFIKIIDLLSEKGIYTLKEAVEASKKSYYAQMKY
ncbi:MAG: hypothetical protein GY760_22025 [Deltaproteobacteria bacterium]|nr:hypothetical protein [Deltaproteobacteria bacterium]